MSTLPAPVNKYELADKQYLFGAANCAAQMYLSMRSIGIEFGTQSSRRYKVMLDDKEVMIFITPLSKDIECAIVGLSTLTFQLRVYHTINRIIVERKSSARKVERISMQEPINYRAFHDLNQSAALFISQFSMGGQAILS